VSQGFGPGTTGQSGIPSADGVSVLAVERVSKAFVGTYALRDVSLAIRPGEVHALLGENGSGKSTLIKVLAGYHAPEPGARILINGEELALPMPPGTFHRAGISFVHQQLGLVPELTVAENLLLNSLATGQGRTRYSQRAAERQAPGHVTLGSSSR